MNELPGSILMQYQTPLPAGTDLANIRKRIAEIAPVFDRLPGMVFKLYGLNDAETSAIVEYSSIYLWKDPKGMFDFLSGELFDNYSAAFARPAVRWFLVDTARGELQAVTAARWAVRRLVPLPRQSPIQSMLSELVTRFRREEAIAQVTGFDPTNWEAINLTVWDKKPQIGDLDHLYSLARTSVPGTQR